MAKGCSLDISWLKETSKKFVGIRNETFVHIDKDGVFYPQQYYSDAGITHKGVEHIIEGLWCLMKKLHVAVLDSELRHDEYKWGRY